MSGNIRRWLVGAFLLGALSFAGAPRVQAQYPYPQDRRDDDRRDRDRDNRRDRNGDYRDRDYRGGRGEYRDYQREIRFLEDRIRREKDEIRFGSRRNGNRSFQMRAAREQLKRDERQLKELKKEWKRAQKDRNSRYDRSRPYYY